MKIDRLLGILTILLAQDKVTAPELARRFEVSRRTISRDLDALCQAGIPIITAQGYDGGISLAAGYKLDKTLLTEDELQDILTGLGGLDSVSRASARGKLLEKLQSLGAQTLSASDEVIIDLASFYQDSLTAKIALIRAAINHHQLITFQYYQATGSQERLVEPYHLVFKWSDWYVLGYCRTRYAFRLFKLNRLWDAQALSETFVPRPVPAEALQLEGYFAKPAFHLQAVFAAKDRHRLIEEYGVDCFSKLSCGRLLLERDFVSYDNMLQWVQSFGDAVLVLTPDELRRELIRQAQNLLRAYQST